MINTAKAEIIAIAFPFSPRNEKTFTFPPDIFEAGSFNNHNNAKIEEKAIAANCTGEKGFLLSLKLVYTKRSFTPYAVAAGVACLAGLAVYAATGKMSLPESLMTAGNGALTRVAAYTPRAAEPAWVDARVQSADEAHALWLRSQAGVAPLKRKK